MSALKFDVLDLIREPDNYLPGERAKASEAIAELFDISKEIDDACTLYQGDAMGLHLEFGLLGGLHSRLKAALARFGGAE